jgi:2-polyprenyl-6-methoxyphenol hydroxylase-like FAD-dependent oxidoreductase
MNKLIKDKEIAIVGGGPGGLTLARLLQMNGADVKVYERDANRNSRPQGATLDLHEESGLAALREAGLMDEFWSNYRPGADKVRIVDKAGNIVMEDSATDADARNRPEIDRGPLQKILLESLKPGTVIWDSQFVSMSQQNNTWKLQFKNGNIAFADIVIAADGANSKLRSYLTDIKPFWIGYMAVEGAVHNSAAACPNMHRLLNGGKIFAMGDDKTLIVSSKGDGSLVFYPGFKSNENWVRECGIDFNDKAQVLSWFKTEFAGWSSDWHELFENASIGFIPRPQYCMPPDQPWEALPNLTIIGDAAHLMPPYAGEGVNMAMLDALELSRCLMSDDFDNLQQAFAAFENQMRTRAAEAAGQSLDSTKLLHSPEAIGFMSQIIS